VQLVILAFEDPEITMNVHCYCGTNQECCVAIKKKHPTLFVRGVVLHKPILMWLTQCSVSAAFHTLEGVK